MFKVRYTTSRGTRSVTFTIEREATMFARQMARTLRLRPTAVSVRAPWGFTSWK